MNETVARVPQQDGGWFLTDVGLETVLIFQEGIALPEFAAFVLLRSQTGREQLRRYFRPYLEIAANTPGSGFVLESPTWRAGVDWGAKLGFDADAIRKVNRDANGDHDNDERGGYRGRARCGTSRPAFGDLVHARDRRRAAERGIAAHGDRGRRRRGRLEQCAARLLHDQLRATRQPSSMPGIPTSSAATTRG